jgi:hypothetical protein
MAKCFECGGAHFTTECPKIAQDVQQQKETPQKRWKRKNKDHVRAYQREYMRKRRAGS